MPQPRAFLELPQQGVVASKQKLESHPDEVRRVLRVFLRSLGWIKENRPGTVEFMRRWLKIDERVAEKSYQMVLETFSWDGGASTQSIERLVELAKQEGEGTKEVSLSELVDFRPLRELRAKGP